MAWTWRYLTADAQDAASKVKVENAEPFTNQSDAESWLGENWRELYAAGVATVELVEDDRVEYEMSLAEA